PYLYSLTLTKCLFSYSFLFNLKSSSIRRLYLYELGCFNEEHCDNLINSPLGIQCDELYITVKERSNIVNLINQMKNLRVLYIRYQEDKWKRNDNELPTQNELVKWLQDNLSKNYVITKSNTNDFSYIQCWIR
ncbi:unnamed protein product, partial [Rotaria sp. Silwood2]